MSMFIFIYDIAMLIAAENFQEVDTYRAIEIDMEEDTDKDMIMETNVYINADR
jgi:hypothetical protein